MTLPALIADRVSAWYDDRQVLFDVSLEFAPKTVTALIGPSGAGKTTLLRRLNRLPRRDRTTRFDGTVTLDGVDTGAMAVRELRRRVGMVFSEPTPFPGSIFDNVAFGLEGLAWRERGERVEAALRACLLYDDVESRLGESAATLGRGQQQRMCIARALALQPDVLLLDEPASELDPIETGLLETVIYGLRETSTVVLVTQDVQQAGRLAGVTAFMSGGRLVEVDATEVLFTRPRHAATEAYLSRRTA